MKTQDVVEDSHLLDNSYKLFQGFHQAHDVHGVDDDDDDGDDDGDDDDDDDGDSDDDDDDDVNDDDKRSINKMMIIIQEVVKFRFYGLLELIEHKILNEMFRSLAQFVCQSAKFLAEKLNW